MSKGQLLWPPYGRLTGKAGVCLATLGPGATNFTTPAAYGFLGGFPLVMITGQKPIKKSKQGQFQIVDVVHLFAPICKNDQTNCQRQYNPIINTGSFQGCRRGKPGPVLLELPEDIAAENVENIDLFIPHERYYAVAGDQVIREAANAIKTSKNPSCF